MPEFENEKIGTSNKRTIAALNSLITNITVGNINGVKLESEAVVLKNEVLEKVTFYFTGQPLLYRDEGETYD